MSHYYKPGRTRNLYDPSSNIPFKLSRSKLEMFINCPCCFYLDRRLGVGQPPQFPFTLNSAVDTLFKKEFDRHRQAGTPHPLFKKFNIEAVPFKHEMMDTWRDALHGGVEYLHPPTNLLISGGVDDIWVDPHGTLIVADYKATAKQEEVKALDKEWQISYKRQAEVYQWLLRKNGFTVSNTAYFVYATGDAGKEEFGDKLEFRTNIIPYEGNDGWVENTLGEIKKCLDSDKIPAVNGECDYCGYREAVAKVMGK
jgi:CRISPR/Cas system-associated exonuclease Cas4 (RecB family)